MRISDWSSDVCSSDLQNDDRQRAPDAKTVDPAPQRLFVAERRQRARFGQSPIDPDQHQPDRRPDPDLGLRYRRVRRFLPPPRRSRDAGLFLVLAPQPYWQQDQILQTRSEGRQVAVM